MCPNSIDNHMISSAISNKFFRIARVRRASAIWGLWKMHKFLFIPNCTRTIVWLLINNFHTKFSDKHLTVCFYLPYGVNALRLQESDWSKHLSSCLYFVACFCFWHYPLNFKLRCCCSQQTCPPFFNFFLLLFFKVPVNHF